VFRCPFIRSRLGGSVRFRPLPLSVAWPACNDDPRTRHLELQRSGRSRMTSNSPADEIREALEAATPGPWEPGDIWLCAGLIYSDSGDRVEDGSATRCAFCRLGEPSWS